MESEIERATDRVKAHGFGEIKIIVKHGDIKEIQVMESFRKTD